MTKWFYQADADDFRVIVYNFCCRIFTSVWEKLFIGHLVPVHKGGWSHSLAKGESLFC